MSEENNKNTIRKYIHFARNYFEKIENRSVFINGLVNITTMVALAVSFIAALDLLGRSTLEHFNEGRTPTLEQRIELLVRSLNSSAETITAIEQEIEQRRRLVDGLRRDAETAEALRQANRQQVDAIAQVLRAEIAREKQGVNWWDLGKNFFFTMLGFGMSEGMNWRRRRREKMAGLSSDGPPSPRTATDKGIGSG